MKTTFDIKIVAEIALVFAVVLIFAVIYLLGKRRLLPVIIGHGIINTISLTAYYLSDGKMT